MRNRAVILDAALRLTQSGVGDVNVNAVAREAGVAVGTVYRHWPSKQDLLRSVLLRRLETVATDAEAAGSLRKFLDTVTERCVQDPTILALLDTGGPGDPFTVAAEKQQSALEAAEERTALRKRLDTAIGALLAEAEDEGRLRLELRPGDVRIYLVGLRAALQSGDADAWRRYRDIYLAGLLGHGEAV